MKLRAPTALAALLFVAAASQANAHHSFAAEFDANQPVELHGTITKMEWINPHSWLHINVKNADGSTVEWMIEGATPNTCFAAVSLVRPSRPAPRSRSSDFARRTARTAPTAAT